MAERKIGIQLHCLLIVLRGEFHILRRKSLNMKLSLQKCFVGSRIDVSRVIKQRLFVA